MRHNALRIEYLKRRQGLVREIRETDNPAKKERLQEALKHFKSSYSGPAVAAANGTWAQQLERFERADKHLAKIERKARETLRREAGPFMAVAQAQVNNLDASEVGAFLKENVSPAEGYARYLAAQTRSRTETEIQAGNDTYHESNKGYQAALTRAQAVAEQTNDLYNSLAGPAGLLETFDDTRLRIQTGRWQANQTMENGALVTEYSLDSDPTDFTEKIEKAQTYSSEG